MTVNYLFLFDHTCQALDRHYGAQKRGEVFQDFLMLHYRKYGALYEQVHEYQGLAEDLLRYRNITFYRYARRWHPAIRGELDTDLGGLEREVNR